jgi:hypothetical protein
MLANLATIIASALGLVSAEAAGDRCTLERYFTLTTS